VSQLFPPSTITCTIVAAGDSRLIHLLTHPLTHSLTNYFTTHDDEVYSCDSSTGKARNGSRSGEEVQVECEWQCGGGQRARGGGEQAGGTVPDGE
jgi:hypothetical protein